MYKIALESEGGISNVSSEDRRIRDQLIENLLKLPAEIITNLRELQPDKGCFNQCSFCGEGAGKTIFRLDAGELANLFAGIKFMGLKIRGLEGCLSEEGVFSEEFIMPEQGLVGYGPKKRRPGAIYPYKDNDITSYPFIDKYVKYAMEDIGVRTRITTVGYGRNDPQLQDANQNLNKTYADCIEAFRLSVTPYTYGWASDKNPVVSKKEFVLDMANTLKTYRPIIDQLLKTGSDASVEFRFKSLIVAGSEFEEKIVLGKHVFHVGPYLLVGMETHSQFTKATVNGRERHILKIDQVPRKYVMLISDSFSLDNSWERVAMELIESGFVMEGNSKAQFLFRNVDLYMFENDDGIYYGVDPIMKKDGLFAKNFYPKAGQRPNSGYIDSERYFLNSLIRYRQSKGLDKTGRLDNATFEDVEKVIGILGSTVNVLGNFDQKGADHIQKEILPLINAYVKALQVAEYPASYFFSPQFTINAGGIRNLWRAFSEFRNIASKPEMAVTPEHEGRYGRNSFFAAEGIIWIISPICVNDVSSLLIEAQDLYERTGVSRGFVKRYIIPFDGVQRLDFETEIRKNRYIIPGQSYN
jgi:hypothetical protein